MEETSLQRCRSRLAALEKDRQGWESHWKELADYLLPHRVRFQQSETNRGQKLNSNIINSTGPKAIGTASSGIAAGMTSASRPWFSITTPDPKLAENDGVREWLHAVQDRIRLALLKSNIYTTFPALDRDLITFGTAAALLEETDKGLRAYVLPIGTFFLDVDHEGRVDTCYRRLTRTVRQLVKQFGRENCSKTVQNHYDERNFNQTVEVVHVIEPNSDRNPKRADFRGMAWASRWFEYSNGDEGKFLRESGYREFPVVAPRWDVTGDDTYGRSPAMEILGDARALQHLERRKAQIIDKIAHPPMNAPASMAMQPTSIVPGAVNFIPTISGSARFEPAVVMDPRAIAEVREEIRAHEVRIKRGLFEDLWLSMLESDRRQITAREIAERHEEKMIQLGPAFERMSDEMLSGVIDRTFYIEARRGNIPVPPKELAGVELRVEYTSIAAQAQKAMEVIAIERLCSFGGNLAAVRPDVLDKLDFDEAIDQYAAAVGTRPNLVRSDDVVAQMRAQAAQAAQAQQQMQAAQVAAEGAKTLSETDVGGDNALTLLSQFAGNVGGALQ